MGQNLRMSWTSVLLLSLAFGLCQSQYKDYGPPPNYDGGSGSAITKTPVATTAPITITTKKPTATTKAPTTNKPSSGKTVVFPKLTSPVAGYKFTKVFGVSVFAHTTVSDAKFQHIASIMAECQAIEYWWWSTAAYTGLLKNRSDVKREFKYYLPEDFKAKDPKMFALITDRAKGYKLPNRPPNGKYTGKKTCASGANVI